MSTLPLNTLVLSNTLAGYVPGSKFMAFYKNSQVAVTDAGIIVQSLGQIIYENRDINSKLYINITPGKLIVTHDNGEDKRPLI